MDGYSQDITETQKQKLYDLFPEAFTEGKLDWDKLRATLGQEVDTDERYGLNWKGKNGVFRAIQERTSKTLKPAPDESVDWDATQNMFIEGDNLEVLKVLHKAYYGRVKMIYIDPPYNTGNDFIYNDKFAESQLEYEKATGIRDEKGNVTRVDGLRRNAKDSGHFHSNWLNMLYPRLYLARNLLRQNGVIFVSIDDNEVHNLRLIMNEIFGEENFVGEYIWHKKLTGGYDNENINMQHEYILVYARDYAGDLLHDEIRESSYKLVDEDGRKFKWDSLWNVGGLTYSASLDYPITAPDGSEVWPLGERGVAFWLWSKQKVEAERDRLKFEKGVDGRWRIYKRIYASDGIVSGSMLDKDIVKGNTHSSSEIKALFGGKKLFDYAKPSTLMKYLVERGSADGDIVLDFFAGSGSFAHGVMAADVDQDMNRRWICVQLPEETAEKSEARLAGFTNIADISRERIKRAATKLQADQKAKLADRRAALDLGFRTYKLSDSNFKPWNNTPQDETALRQQMLSSINPILENVAVADLLTELLLKNGISPLEKVENHDDFFSVPDSKLAISLTNTLTAEIFAKILAGKPAKIILLDSSFAASDELKTNLLLQAEQQQVEVEVI